MENHQRYLKEICRICGNKIVTRRGYPYAKHCDEYASIILRHIGLNVQSENGMIYPKNLCSSCKNRMQYIENNDEDYKQPSKVATFSPHQESNCLVCSKFVSTRSRSNVTVKQMDKEFISNGFLRTGDLKNEKVYVKIINNKETAFIAMSVHVAQDFSWTCFVFQKQISDRLLEKGLPSLLSDKNDLAVFCEKLGKLGICHANTDYQEVLNFRIDFNEPFPNAAMTDRVAWAESSLRKTPFIKEEFDAIRATTCQYVVDEEGDLCDSCKSFRKNLSKYRQRVVEQDKNVENRVDPSSHINLKNLKIEELETRIKNLQISKRQSLNQLAQASRKIEKMLRKEGIEAKTMSKSQHELLTYITNNKMPDFEEGSPQWLLWMQQAKQSSAKDSRGMRWHPLIIRWCLSIYAISPAAYKHISSKQNKFLVLPHVNTLKDFISFTTPSTGFNIDVISKIITDNNIASLKDYQRNVCLSFDEIKIKSGLVYKRGSGKVIGFTDMGTINDELRQLIASDEDDNAEGEASDIATYVIVLMIRGLFTSLCVPIAYFASTGFRGDQLCPIILEATRILEALSFKVRCWTSDGAAPNRKLYQIVSQGDEFNFMTNIFDNKRKIYFISDVPHLLKTLRNNLENSHGHLKSRNLMFNDMSISWMHIIDVYEWDLGYNRMSPGLRMLHKVKEEHVRLTPQHRMSVRYAAQVISSTMGKALQMQDRSDTKETIRFLELFDRAFDCLNVSKVGGQDKPDRKPYFSPDDPRFEFLKTVLEYFEEWENQVTAIPTITKDDRARLQMSHQTVFGWKLTITSFINLGKKLLEEAGEGKFLLSEKLSQDPLEEHFSRHRRLAGCSDNPTLAQFEQQEIALHAMSSNLISDLRGNTRGRQQDRVQLSADDMRLPKKRKSSS